MMDEKNIQRFKQQLLSSQTSLKDAEVSAKQDAGTVELDQSRLGRLSRMDALQSQQMALETARRQELQLIKINGALKRIENGDFGVCFACGEEIDNRRLEIDPSSTRCIGCVEANV